MTTVTVRSQPAIIDAGKLRATIERGYESSAQYAAIRRAIGDDIADTWRKAVDGQRLPGMSSPLTSTRYRDAIGTPRLTPNGVQVPVTNAEAQIIARRIEAGHRQIDMKPILLKNAKHRDKQGQPYAIVPLQQSLGRGGTIPQRFHFLINKRIQGRQQAFAPVFAAEKKAHAQSPRSHMNFGRRTSRSNYAQKFGHLSGLSSGSSGLVTFRTVSSRSDPQSWVIPPRLPNHIVDAVLQDVISRWRLQRT